MCTTNPITACQAPIEDEGAEEEVDHEDGTADDALRQRKKLGKKKQEKLQRKEEMRQYREYMESVREEERL